MKFRLGRSVQWFEKVVKVTCGNARAYAISVQVVETFSFCESLLSAFGADLESLCTVCTFPHESQWQKWTEGQECKRMCSYRSWGALIRWGMIICSNCDIALAIGQCFPIKLLTAIQKQIELAIFSCVTFSEIKSRSFTINGLEITHKNRHGHVPMIRWDSTEPRSHKWMRIIWYRTRPDKVLNLAICHWTPKGYSSKKYSLAIVKNKPTD